MCRSFLLSVLFLTALPTISNGQFDWNRKRENLKVLPDTISGEQLRSTMRGFAQALGVRCHFCHDDSKGQRLSEIDFASDAKPEKESARTMLRMVSAINGDWLPKIDAEGPHTRVTCITCHRGVNRPEPLESVLIGTLDRGGPDSLNAAYYKLRDRYYGRMAFDFGEETLSGLGRLLINEGRISDAISVLQLNADVFPTSANVYDALGEAFLAASDSMTATGYFERALSIDPEHGSAARHLEAMRSEK